MIEQGMPLDDSLPLPLHQGKATPSSASSSQNQRIRNSLSQQKTAAVMSLPPIGMVPPELIRKIVVQTIEGPRAHRQIMCLSQVSKLWRDVVFGISALFTAANWEQWPISLVDAWCSRAKAQLLMIYMGRSLHTLADTSGGPYHALLKKVAVQIGQLAIFCNRRSSPGAIRLFELRMPSLQRLSIWDADSVLEGIYIQSQNLPMLRVLKLRVSKAEIPTPLSSVTHFHYHNFSHILPSYRAIFSKLPHLQHLALTLHDYPGSTVGTSSEPRVVLPLITSLEVGWMAKTSNVDSALFLFDFFQLPKLQSIVLHEDYICKEYETLFRSLV